MSLGSFISTSVCKTFSVVFKHVSTFREVVLNSLFRKYDFALVKISNLFNSFHKEVDFLYHGYQQLRLRKKTMTKWFLIVFKISNFNLSNEICITLSHNILFVSSWLRNHQNVELWLLLPSLRNLMFMFSKSLLPTFSRVIARSERPH